MAKRGDRNGIASSVGDVGGAKDVPGIVEPGRDPVDGVAVQSELTAEVGLAEWTVFFQRGEQCKVGTPGRGHPRPGEPGAEDVHSICLPTEQGP